MLSILLLPLWALIYFVSPYFFVAVSAFFYFTEWYSEILHILVTFPLGLFYIQQKLQNGEQPDHPTTLIWELARWIICWILVWNEWLEPAQYNALSGYTYITAITLLMATRDDNIIKLNDIKFRCYLLWIGWIIFKLCLNPINMMMALILHGINFYIDFRLADFTV